MPCRCNGEYKIGAGGGGFEPTPGPDSPGDDEFCRWFEGGSGLSRALTLNESLDLKT